MNQSEDQHGPKSDSGARPNDSLTGPGLHPRSVVLITIVLLLIGIEGYRGYWAAMGRYAVVDPGRLYRCEHGVGRTGLHAAIYRMEFQGWSKRCARIEAMLLAGFDSFQKDTDKARFIESYTPRSR